jgi:hypothetical protein
MIDIRAFIDELEKISAAPGQVLTGARNLVKANPNLIKYPLIGGAGITAWEMLRKAKRRYDIGKAYEEAQGG